MSLLNLSRRNRPTRAYSFETKNRRAIFALIGTVVLFVLTLIASWITHVAACIKASAWVLLVIGVFVPPIGWLHGVLVWFGAV